MQYSEDTSNSPHELHPFAFDDGVSDSQLIRVAQQLETLHEPAPLHVKQSNPKLSVQPECQNLEASECGDYQQNDHQEEPDLSKCTASEEMIPQAPRHVETMVIFVKHEMSKHPTPYTVSTDMTVGRLTHAEAKLGTLALPIAPRSLVGTHVPLDAEMHPNQYVMLHQKLPKSIKCPYVSTKFAHFAHEVDLGLPCTRFEALWRQQAWVANDEMDYYLEAVQVENKALPFPTASFLNESEAIEWAYEWLSVAMFTNEIGKPWCSAAIVGAHWIPIVIQHHCKVIQVSTTPEGACFLPQVTQIANEQGKTIEIHQRLLPQSFPADCGFQALAWMIAIVNELKVEPLSPSKASQWRHLFVRELCRTRRGHEVVHKLPVGGTRFAQIKVKTVGQSISIYGEVGIGVLDALKLLTNESIPTIRAVTVEDANLGQIALPDDHQLTSEGIELFVDSPCSLLLSEQDVVASDWPIVVVLHSLGILILKRQPGYLSFDVETAIENFDFEWEAPLLDYTGNRLIEDSIAPNIVFLGITAKTLDFWEMLRLPIIFSELAQGYVASIPQNQVHAFIHWIEKTGVHALIRSCGWQFLSQLNQDPASVPVEVYLLPRSDRLPAAPRALCQLVIERIFINQIKFRATNPMLGDNVCVSLKLWRTWIWTGTIGSEETTQFIHQAWQLAHQFFGDSTPIRLITQGSQINPDWSISNYMQTTGPGEHIMKVHVVLQLHGGGPSDEQPPRSIHEAYSFQELEDLEQADVSRLISVLIQNLVDVPADEQHIDLGVIRNATLRRDGPSFTMVGSVSTVVRLMRDLSATGVEALIRAMGWITAMSISDTRPPVQVQLHLMPKTGVRHLSQTTMESFLAHALTIRSMPIPSGLDGDILVKVKLADSWILVGRFHPDTSMSIFVDPWYRATTFFGRPSRLRMICNSAQANPDRCLGEYARTNEMGERFAKLFLVLQLQGGGPKAGETEEVWSHPKEDLQEVLLTVPRDKDFRLLCLPGATQLRDAFEHIRPDSNISEWTPTDSFGLPLDWNGPVLGNACIHFLYNTDNDENPNGLVHLISSHCKTGVTEMEFYLRHQAKDAQYKPIAPICITGAKGSHARNQQLKQWLEGLLEHAMASSRPVASMCLVDQHWVPFVAHVNFEILQVQTTTVGMDLLPQIERCCRRPHQPMPHAPPLWLRLPVNFMTRQCHVRFPDDCGFQTIVWIMNHMCTRKPVEWLSIENALQWRDGYLRRIASCEPESLYSLPACMNVGGAEAEAKTKVSRPHHSLGLDSQSERAERPRKALRENSTMVNSVGKCEGVFSCLSPWSETEEHVQTMSSSDSLGLYDAWIGARLCAKSPSQLRNMPSPNPSNAEQLEAVRENLMSKHHRLKLLHNQEDLWADDEVMYHLQAMEKMVGQENRVQILDPLIAGAWYSSGSSDPHRLLERQTKWVITALHYQKHWVPLIFLKQGDYLNVHTWAQPRQIPKDVETLVVSIQSLLGCMTHRWILYHTRVPTSHACGAQAIALVGHVLLRLPLPQGNSEVSMLDNLLKKRFAKHLPDHCAIPYLWASGTDDIADAPEASNKGVGHMNDYPLPQGLLDRWMNGHYPILQLPCTRVEALEHQSAWVAQDEMDYYLDRVQKETEAINFPTAVFPSESEAAQGMYDWLAAALQTDAREPRHRDAPLPW
eukprot:s3651_g4.t1